MDYEEILKKLKKRKEYFDSIDFPLIAKDYLLAIETIESLISKEENEVKVGE